MRKYGSLILTIIALQALSYASSYKVTMSAVDGWYQDIAKSPFNPPDWVFGPVWIVLYTLLAIVLWMLWARRDERFARSALRFFLPQLAINYLWSYVFFGMAAYAPAFWLLIVMIICTVGCMVYARHLAERKDVIVWLLSPYLAWISFAAYLTWSVMRLNP